MSQPVMALPAAGLGDADRSYGEMVGLAANNAAAFETEAAQISATLRGPGTTPRLSGDVAFALRNMREGLFPILQSVMGGLADTDAQDALKLAEAGVRARLVVQARTAVEARNRATPGMGWTRYLGGTGTTLRNMVGVWNEAGVFRVAWGEGSFEERRIQQEVRNQINLRFAGRTFDTLDPADQDMVRQEVGRLAPNTVAFNMQDLLEWARANPSGVPEDLNAVPPGPPYRTYYNLLEGILGRQEVSSRYAIPILTMVQKNQAYRDHLEAIYRSRVAQPPAQARYEAERRRRSNQDVQKTRTAERIQRMEATMGILSKIREKEQSREQNTDNASTATTDLAAIPPNSQQERKALTESKGRFIAAATQAFTEMTGLIGELKAKYPRELVEASTPRPGVGAPPPTPPAIATLLNYTTPGGLTTKTEPDTCIDRLQEMLEGAPAVAANPGPPPVLPMDPIVGLRNELIQLNEEVSRRDEAYSTTDPNADIQALARDGYKSFVDLKEKNDKSVESRGSGNNLTPHQLLYELNYRQLVVEIPPPAGGPAARNARNLALEDAMVRATISTLMLIDRVDSSMDEGFAVRHAQNITRTRLTRWAERKARLTFGQFVKNNLTRQERFKGLKDLKLDTNANTILQWVNEEKLKEADLRPLMSEIELAGQDQLGGKGKLEFNLDVRPLLFQIQLAQYRRSAEALVAKAGEPGVGKKAEVMLALIGTEAPKLVPTPAAPGSKPSDLETNTESYLRQRKETLKEEAEGLPAGSPERTAKERALRFLENPLVRELGSELFAEAAIRGVVEASKLFSRRAVKKVAEEVGEEAEDALSAVRRRTNRKATRAITGTAAKLAA